MSQQLDFWGMYPDRRVSGEEDGSQAFDEGVSLTSKSIAKTAAKNTAQTTLQLASRSYLVPWFEALLLAYAHRADNSIHAESLSQVLAAVGQVHGHSFQSWWSAGGFAHLGHGLTDVSVSYPAKRGGNGAAVASFVVALTLPIHAAQQQISFLLEQLARFHTGVLSSSPLLWPSFRSALTIQRLCLYLKVVRAVIALPAEAKHKILTVGQEMNLVPKQKVRTYDLAGERGEKRDAIVHITYDYFQKGRALVINAARVNFPCVVMPREFVKTRRKRAKLTAAQYAKWGT